MPEQEFTDHVIRGIPKCEHIEFRQSRQQNALCFRISSNAYEAFTQADFDSGESTNMP